MGDKESKKEKKNTPAMGKTMRRKKKKGPAAAVKIPSGSISISYYLILLYPTQ